MEFEAFLNDMAEVLEVDRDKLQPEFEFTNDVWDSMTVVSAIVLIDEHFDLNLEDGDLKECTSLGRLLEKIREQKTE